MHISFTLLSLFKKFDVKWDFFYKDGDGEPYESVDEWVKEINHLIWPTIIMLLLAIAAYCFLNYFYS